VSIAYAATTDLCTFLLDDDGVCRRVLLQPDRRSETTLGGLTRAQAARRCIGAQYVASIDAHVDGGLVPMPRVGTPMLFAYMGDDGRLAVVRTGALVRFETVGGESRDEIRVEWDAGGGDDDECLTVPLAQSGERLTPRASPFDPGEEPIDLGEEADTLRDPWHPPPRPAWVTMPAAGVRLQKVNVVGPRESAPTLTRVTAPSGRGMLPRQARKPPPQRGLGRG
jgi:hypothetical protein